MGVILTYSKCRQDRQKITPHDFLDTRVVTGTISIKQSNKLVLFIEASTAGIL